MAKNLRSKDAVSSPATSEELSKLGETLRNSILEIRNVVIQNILEENKKLKTKVISLETRVELLEENLAAQDLYCRRNNIEISGIPDDIQQNQLETKVIEICQKIGVDFTHNEIEACHRLQGNNNPKKTIVRFVNRKHCIKMIKNRKKLPRNLFINANLNQYYHRLAFCCRKLKKSGHIFATRYDSTSVLIKLAETSKPIRINSMNTLHDLFTDYNFGEDQHS